MHAKAFMWSGRERTTCRTWFSPIIWVLKVKFRSLYLGQPPFLMIHLTGTLLFGDRQSCDFYILKVVDAAAVSVRMQIFEILISVL